MKPAGLVLLLLSVLLASGCSRDDPTPPGGDFACHAGAWQLADGAVMALVP